MEATRHQQPTLQGDLRPSSGDRPLFAGETLVYGLICLAVSTLLIVTAVEAALHFSGPPLDGPFQLYNALRRIDAGQRGGADFQFFHGIGVPYLHYLPFKLFGSSFTASELTRQLTSAIAYPVGLLAVFGIWTRNWRRTLGLSAVGLTLSVALPLLTLMFARNSLLGIRTALPTLVPMFWCLPIARRRRAMLMGGGLGSCLLLGTEQGLAAIVAFVVVSAVVLARGGDRRARLGDLGIALVTIVMVVVGVGLAIGGGDGLRGMLRYNLRLVPSDQYWYFGAPPNPFIHGWGSLSSQVPIGITVTVLAGLLVAFITLRRLGSGTSTGADLASAQLATYGVVACASLLGILLPGYTLPCRRALLIVLVIEADRRFGGRVYRSRWHPLPTAVGVSTLVMILMTPTVFPTLTRRLAHVVSTHLVRGEGMRFDALWPATLAVDERAVAAWTATNGVPPRIWSTYSGLLEARTGQLNPSFDYIIHALGTENRRRYVETFNLEKPDLVQTVQPTYSQYEAWIEQTSWDFYATLLRNYRVIGETPWSILWSRRTAPDRPWLPYWSARLSPSDTAAIVPLPGQAGAGGLALIEVQLDYNVRNPLHVLPVIGALPRHLAILGNAAAPDSITLDPYASSARFPVIARPGEPVRISIRTYSLLPGAGIDVRRIAASIVPVTEHNLAWATHVAEAADIRSGRGKVVDRSPP